MKKRFILSLIVGAFCLSSCNNQASNKENDTPYVYDENRILVKDFTVKDARKCIEIFKKNCQYPYKNIDTCNFDFYFYLGTYNDYKFVQMNWWEYPNPTTGLGRGETSFGNDNDLILEEYIDGFCFDWTKEKLSMYKKPRLFVEDKCYTLTEAYSLKYVNHDDLEKIYDIWNNKRDEYKIMARFIGDNNKEYAKTWDD